MLRAAIYDMDGLLLDSEPYWVQAELEVLGEVGVPLTMALAGETTGMRPRRGGGALVPPLPVEGEEPAPGAGAAHAGGARPHPRQQAEAKPGVRQSLELFAKRGIRSRARFSSSPLVLIDAVVEKPGLDGQFELTVSAESEALGKPHRQVLQLRGASSR